MRIETLSIFPEFFEPYMSSSIMGIAQEKNKLTFKAHDLRKWTHDRHRTVDDEPYGGGQGMLMKCEPIFEAYDELSHGSNPHTIFFSPVGKPFTQHDAYDLSEKSHILMICGRYEGIDERAYTLADQIISLGDYVLTGGELPALVVIDAIVRLLPGVLGDDLSAHDESFAQGMLEYAQYTRPASFRGMDVPDVLLSGNHKKIKEWKLQSRKQRTQQFRPDLFHNLADKF